MSFRRLVQQLIQYGAIALLASLLLGVELSNEALTIADAWNLVFAGILLFSVIRLLYSVGLYTIRQFRGTDDMVMTQAVGSGIARSYITKAQQKALEDSLPSRARHEAAHAVAVHVLGHTLVEVSTIPNLREGSGGHCVWVPRDDETKATVDHVTIALAGPVMEQPDHRQLNVLNPHDDFIDAQRDALQVAVLNRGLTASQVLDEGLSQAQRLVNMYRPMIEYVAEALIAREHDGSLKPVALTAAEVEHVIATYTEHHGEHEAA